MFISLTNHFRQRHFVTDDNETITNENSVIGLFLFIMCVMPDKAVFVSAVLLCVQRYGETAIFTASKAHLVAKNEFAFSFRPTCKSSFPRRARVQQVGSNMLMFQTAWDSFINDSFQWFRVDSFFWEKITLFRLNTLQDVFIHLELLHTAWKLI